MNEEGSRETILVVDDFKTNVEYLRDILEAEYRVVAAYNGDEAIATAQAERPDLILLDVMMPGKDGYAVCQELKSDIRTANIPIIFVTALGDEKDEARAFEAGGSDFLTKPVKVVVAKRRIRTQLERQYQLRRLEAEVEKRTNEIETTRARIIECLGKASEFRDNETGNHVIRMSGYAERIGLAYGLPEEEARLYRFATPMHDVGKIGIRDSILLKPGKLDPEEFAEMKKHCEIGERILGDDGSALLHTAAICAKTHHERWDGKGYPQGLAGDDIPLVGRIATVADVFDALTSVRPYKEAWPIGRATAEIQNASGTQFDPAVVSAFAKALESILEIRESYIES
jgi:putative two-component system response regulator